jgi:hypothetical protein
MICSQKSIDLNCIAIEGNEHSNFISTISFRLFHSHSASGLH